MGTPRVRRGEAKVFAVRLGMTESKEEFPLGNVDEIAFKVGDVRKTWPGDVAYDAEKQRFLLTLTQEDTLSLDTGAQEVEVTVNFKGPGNILKPWANPKIRVKDSLDEELME
nr:MAG TPA: hypothetical protein [Caudoviricetes sp.]